MDKLLIKDLKFIKDVSPELADAVISMFVANIDQTYNMLMNPETDLDKFLDGLTEDKLKELDTFYISAEEIFIERELYEECAKLIYIKECLKKL